MKFRCHLFLLFLKTYFVPQGIGGTMDQPAFHACPVRNIQQRGVPVRQVQNPQHRHLIGNGILLATQGPIKPMFAKLRTASWIEVDIFPVALKNLKNLQAFEKGIC